MLQVDFIVILFNQKKDYNIFIKKREKITIEIDRFKAISESIKFANKEDIVLIAGKGHEDYQILNDKVINFDDRKIAYKLLKEKNKSQ